MYRCGFVIHVLLLPQNFSHDLIAPRILPLSGVAAPFPCRSAVSPVWLMRSVRAAAQSSSLTFRTAAHWSSIDSEVTNHWRVRLRMSGGGIRKRLWEDLEPSSSSYTQIHCLNASETFMEWNPVLLKKLECYQVEGHKQRLRGAFPSQWRYPVTESAAYSGGSSQADTVSEGTVGIWFLLFFLSCLLLDGGPFLASALCFGDGASFFPSLPPPPLVLQQ